MGNAYDDMKTLMEGKKRRITEGANSLAELRAFLEDLKGMELLMKGGQINDFMDALSDEGGTEISFLRAQLDELGDSLSSSGSAVDSLLSTLNDIENPKPKSQSRPRGSGGFGSGAAWSGFGPRG